MILQILEGEILNFETFEGYTRNSPLDNYPKRVLLSLIKDYTIKIIKKNSWQM